MSADAPSFIEDISSFSRDLTFETLPRDARSHTISALMNWVGCAVGGARSETMDTAIRAFQAFSASGKIRIFGRTETAEPGHAALLSCLGSAAYAFDDTHLETILHPTGPVAAALFSAAQIKTMNGKDFITFLAAGLEVQCRIALAIVKSAGGSARGWYSTGLAGGIGAAIAVARALGLSSAEMRTAIGLAAARAAGNRGTHGSMACALVPAVTAEIGLQSAYLAASGFTCSEEAFAGDRGMLNLVSGKPNIDLALKDLGTEFQLLKVTFKPYPCGIVAHPAVDASLQLVKSGCDTGAIERVDIQLSRAAFELVTKRAPKDIYEAQVSVYHWVAAVLVKRHAKMELAMKAAIDDPAILKMQEKIHATLNEKLNDNQCTLEVHLRNAEPISVRIEDTVGSATKPMSRQAIKAKFLDQCEQGLGMRKAETLLQRCEDIVTSSDVSSILD